MALSNAERQARHRARMKAKLAEPRSASPATARVKESPVPDKGQEALNRFRLEFQAGMIEVLEVGSDSDNPEIFESQQMAVRRFNNMGTAGQLKLMYAELRRAGHAAAFKIAEECRREWKENHPEPERPRGFFRART